MSETPNAVARRGDLVVICLRHRDWHAYRKQHEQAAGNGSVAA